MLVRLLESLAKLCAILAGVLLTAVTLMTCASLIGRNFLRMTIVGDFELSGAAAGAAVALFMPWCQFQRGNIIVDVFTARAAARTRALMDGFGTLLYTLAMALICWRLAAGGLAALETRETSMLMGFPLWIAYLLMAPGLALAAAIGLADTARHWLARDPEGP